MNFQTSTHCSAWLLTAEQLKQKRKANRESALEAIRKLRAAGPAATDETPNENASEQTKASEPGSKLKALKLDEEALLLRFYAGKAQAMCRAFHFPGKVAQTAVTYLQRFFTRHSVLDHHPRDVMLAAVYVACKVEEAYMSAEELSRVVQQDPSGVLRMELVLLRGLGFDLIVHTPLRPLDGFFQDLAASRDGAAPASGTAAPAAAAAGASDGGQGHSNGSAAGQDVSSEGVVLGPYASQAWQSAEGAPAAAPLDGGLRALSDKQLAQARSAAGAAADSLMLTDAPLMFPPGQLALAAMRAAFRKIEVPLSSYLARVADRVSRPRADAHDAAVTAESRLAELKAVLTQIDSFGMQGAESVDEAQVRKLERKWKQCHNPLHDPSTDAYRQAEAEAAQKLDQRRADKIRKRQEAYAAQVASLLGPMPSHEPPPAKRRRSELV